MRRRLPRLNGVSKLHERHTIFQVINIFLCYLHAMRWRIVKVLAVFAVLFVAACGMFLLYVSHEIRQSAIPTSVQWARLAPLPPSAQNVNIDVTGGLFTRGFIISFE